MPKFQPVVRVNLIVNSSEFFEFSVTIDGIPLHKTIAIFDLGTQKWRGVDYARETDDADFKPTGPTDSENLVYVVLMIREAYPDAPYPTFN